MIKKTTISLLTIFFALNTAVVLAAGSNPNGIAPENQSETTPPSNNTPKGTMEAVMGNDADTNTTTTQTITTQSETTNTNTTQKQQSNALKRKGMVCTKAKEHHLLATYDDNQNCIVKTCVAGYEVSDNKCIKKTNKDNSNTSPSSQNGTNSTDEYESAKETEQSKANRLLTSASTAATGIGTMELAQGLAEQKADKAAEQAISAYISTMRCSYGNGKSVKAGADEIELPGGNDANLMKYRSEYTALANDLKERKTALNMMPGIESEEILDKSQMELYDDENIGITAGNYASRYRAQMLGSESDQTQLDEAAKTSKTRVIGGAVAAGAGVVGGIVGDELINQSLSSSTKTAQTCTESGGTWQGARCHCPDGFIQRTKTGPCFEEKPTEVQTTTPPQRNNPVLSSNGSGNNGSDGNGGDGNGGDGNGQSGGTSDGDNGAGDSDEKGDSSIVDITDTSFEGDEFESAEFDEITDAAVIEYEKSEMCRRFYGNWEDGQCFCTNSFTSNQYIECVQDTNAPTVTTSAPVVATASTAVVATTATNSSTNINDSSADSSTSQTKTSSPAAAVVTNTDKTKTKANSDTLKPDTNSNPSDNSNNQNGNDDSQETQNQQSNLYEKNCEKNGGKINKQGTCICPDGSAANITGDCLNPNTFDNDTSNLDAPNNDKTISSQTEATCGVVGKKECNSNYYVCASDSDCTSDKLPANATAGHCWKSGSRSVCTATACKDGFEPTSGYCKKREVADRNTNAQKTNTQANKSVTRDTKKTDPCAKVDKSKFKTVTALSNGRCQVECKYGYIFDSVHKKCESAYNYPGGTQGQTKGFI